MVLEKAQKSKEQLVNKIAQIKKKKEALFFEAFEKYSKKMVLFLLLNHRVLFIFM